MKKIFLKVALFASLMSVSFAYSSCSKEDDSPAQNNQEVTGGTTDKPSDEKTDDVVLVSELKCTVAEFATKYTTLKKGEKVNVTITDVSDANISKVAQTLQKMSVTTISKAASDDNYIVVLVLESKDDLTTIPAEIFKDCTAIVSVSIPECVELIESGAFDGCTALETVKILSEVAVIQEGAFAENVKVEKKENEVEERFLKCSELEKYLAGCTSDEVSVYLSLDGYDQTQLKEALIGTDKKVDLYLPDGLTEIKEPAFTYGVPNLIRINIPPSVQNIVTYAFAGCENLKEITIPSGITSIPDLCFHGCASLSSVVIPQSVTSIGNFAFTSCESLVDITIPEDVTEIGQCAFAATGITSISIPQGVKVLSSVIFERCTNLTSVSLPDGLEVIGSAAFRDCSNLKSLTIPNSVTEISINAFENCEVAFTKPENTLWVSESYYLETFLDNCTDDVVKLKMSSEFNSDSECFTLENNALKNSSNKVSLILDPTENYIGGNYFKDCNSIVSVEIPGIVMFVGYSSFMGCSNLETIVMGEGVLSIYDDAFNGCNKLISVTLPNSLSSIGEGAFDNCPSLQTIYCSQAIYNEYHESYPQMVVK